MNKTATIQMDPVQLAVLLSSVPEGATVTRTDNQVIVTARSNRTGQLVNPIVATRHKWSWMWTVTAPVGLIKAK
jgi:hypothetical protein